MQTTIRRLDSCLAWYAGVFGSLLLIFGISYIVDTIRLANAWNEAYTLAAKLGNTPERHLVSKVERELSIIPIDAACEVRVFFTTPLDPTDFAARLEQSVASLTDGSSGRNMYSQLPFIVDGSNTKRLYRDEIEKLPPAYQHTWFVMDARGPIKMRIVYAEFSQANAKIEYDGKQITENVAYVSVDAGRFPLWMRSKC